MSWNDNNSNKQQLDLTATLPVATGGLSMEDSVGPVNALKVAAVPQNLVQSAEASTTTPTVNKLDYDGISLVGRKSKDVKPGEKNDSLDIPSQSVEDLMSDDDDDNNNNNNKNNNIPNPAGSGYGEGSISDYVGISLQPYPTDEKKNDSLDIPEINQPDVTTPNLSHSDEASTSTPIIDCITDVNQTPYYVDKSDDETIDFLLDCAERGQNRGNQRPPSIFKVSRILGDHSESSFNPQLVSIGPIHREDPKLKEFEWLKECYLDDLLNRCDSTPKKTLEACLLKVNTLIDQIRESYPGVIKNYSDVELARMMVMDGFFILEFCFKHEDEDSDLQNKMQNLRIAMDLMLLENQVPFFVLQALFDCSMGKVSFTLSNVLDQYLAPYIKLLFRSQLHEEIPTTYVDSDSTDHVLGYLHRRYQLVVAKSSNNPKYAEASKPVDEELASKSSNPIPADAEASKPVNEERIDNTYAAFHSIVELEISGVNFKPHQEDVWSMTIKFQSSLLASWFGSKATLLMPTLVIDKFTELILRNFIAYEQSFPQDHYYFSSYAHAMDMLIDTQEDIAKLVESEVLVNDLGSNQEAADMINRICKNVFVKDFYYTEEFKQMDEYYNHYWSKKIAWLSRDFARVRHAYLNNSWKVIAVLGALVLFGLTMIQTIYTIRAA